MSSHRNETIKAPKANEPESGSIIATAAVLLVALVIVGMVLVCRMCRKRSGPLWITKFYDQEPYSSMRNDDTSPKNEHFIIGFSNTIMESATSKLDSQDGGVKVLGYKPLNTDKLPGEKGDHLTQYKFLFPREKLIFGPEIGTGWFGKVYKGEALRIVAGLRKTKVVIKKLKDDTNSQLRTRFVQEAEILKSLNHKNVLGILGKATEKEPYIVVFEHSPMGNLKEFLIAHKCDAPSIKSKGIPLNMAIDIAAGLQYLHSNFIYYSDLAARNCVVDADLSVKIGDYGISRSLYENDYYKELNSSEESIPIRWLEPESVSFPKDSGLIIKPPTAMSNVWSYGVTVWEVIDFGRMPYEELTDEEVIQSVIVDRLYQLPEPKEEGILASQLYETMRWCWAEAAKRPSIQDMLTYLIDLKENFPFSGNAVTEPDEHRKDTSFHQEHLQKYTTQQDTRSFQLETNPEIIERDTRDTVSSFEPFGVSTNGGEKQKYDDVEITEICDDETVPVTVISSTDQEGQNLENKPYGEHLQSEVHKIISSNSDVECNHPGTPPPVTYIRDPTCALAEYERKISESTQEVINPATAGSEIVEITYSGMEPSVILENCSSGYVVLPGDIVRRKSSLRRENAKSRGQSVHFPANILDLRVIYHYCKEEEEEEDGQVLSHHIQNDDIIDNEESNFSLTENQESRPHDLLITSKMSEDNITTATNISGVTERPTSPVEKKIKKGLRRKKLNQHNEEWLFSLDEERYKK